MKALTFFSSLIAINVLLVTPQWIASGRLGPSLIALESLLIVGFIVLLPAGRWRVSLATTASFSVILASGLLFANAVTWQSLARPLNLYLDVHLWRAIYNLMVGILGTTMAVVVGIGLVLGILILTWLLACLLSFNERAGRKFFIRVSGIALILISFTAIASDNTLGLSQRITLPAVRIVTEQTQSVVRMLGEKERVINELAGTPSSYANLPNLLQKLRNRDVVMAFIESYGVSALYDPDYAQVIRPSLNNLADRTADAGLHLATGTLVAPTQGGQSWFSHLSLFSGIWLDNQLSYDVTLASGRETLLDDFQRAGHRTIALFPANTMAWPEGELLAYDEILSRREIDYAGPPLNWVTMPDQFTWSFLERRIRATNGVDNRPIFAEVSLISSHAPWTPILPVLEDWDNIGNGAIFERWKNTGERPEELWRDLDKIRKHYALSVDYAIKAMTGYAERYVDDQILLIVLGDHQAAPLITGEDTSRAVPVHIISGEQELVQPFLDWGFESGALPDPNEPAPGMDAFRDWFVRAFSKSARITETTAAIEHN